MRIVVALVGLVLVGCGGGAKQAPATCGNGVVDTGEDCDGGANCNADCTFVCSDPATDCPAPASCATAACTADHACTETAVADGTSCGSGMVCSNGTCASGTCGDGFVTGTEECDDGNTVDGDGCNGDCTFSCVSTDPTRDCTPADACAGQGTCNDATHVCAPGQALPDNTDCGTTGYCKQGVCTQPTCGNGIVERGEDCDGGVGCASCHWICVNPATDCPAAPACNLEQCTAQHTCQTVADSSQNGHACGAGGTCNAGTCQTSGASCGNGVLEGTEQCDDSNLTNLDGCDASCKFEQVQRMTNFKIAFMHSTSCPKDALGEAIVGVDNSFFGAGARTQITQAIDNGVADGSITVELQALGMTDLTGVSSQTVQIGILGGLPTSSTATYSGTADKDWWYTTDTTTINASRVALKQLTGTIASKSLTTSPGEILVTVSFVGVAVTMDIFHATLASTLNASDTPTVSTNGMAPGHLASEHLLPTLTSFASMAAGGATTGCTSGVTSTCRCYIVTNGKGAAATCPTGELCGITKARSLFNVLMPSSLTGTACGNLYTTANTLLDIYISGCNGGGFSALPEVAITQPDSAIDNNGNPTTDKYVFTAGANHMVSNGTCTKNGQPDTLNDCLDHAGYSSLFQFAADRVIPK